LCHFFFFFYSLKNIGQLRRELARVHLLLRDFSSAEAVMAPGLQAVQTGLAMVGEEREKKGSGSEEGESASFCVSV
jgi:hypothetical protein